MSQGGWDDYAAAKEAARRKFTEGKFCPNCGAKADVELIDVRQVGQPTEFLPGLFTCSASCFDEDPDAYLEAIRTNEP